MALLYLNRRIVYPLISGQHCSETSLTDILISFVPIIQDCRQLCLCFSIFFIGADKSHLVGFIFGSWHGE